MKSFDPEALSRNGQSNRDRFWSFVKVLGPDQCWLYQLTPTSERGQFTIGRLCFTPARVSYFLTHGQWPQPYVLHSCDTPRCCNPAHLRAGTAAENASDAVERGRTLVQVGQLNHASKLSDGQAQEIRNRRLAGEKGVNLAKEFGVSPTTVSEIFNMKHWTGQRSKTSVKIEP